MAITVGIAVFFVILGVARIAYNIGRKNERGTMIVQMQTLANINVDLREQLIEQRAKLAYMLTNGGKN